jgi:mannose-6-phosphate isomerase-like protein (cupin superfamily)
VKYTRIYADSAGESHFDDVEVELTQTNFAPPAPPINLSSFNPALRYAFGSFPVGWRGDWHPTPTRHIFFILSGEAKVQVSNGEERYLQTGSIVLAEDAIGKGHVSWVTSKNDMQTAVVQLPL